MVTAAARGLTAAVRVALVPGSNQDVALAMRATGIARGHVMHAGAPVAGVEIAVDHADASADTAISQPDGSFVLDGVPLGEVTLVTWPDRVTSRATTIVAGDHNHVELEVEPLASVAGTVLRHGNPISFARVCISTAQSRNTCANSDAAGRYALLGLDAGAHTLFADDDDAGAFVANVPVTLAAAEHRALDVDLAFGARIAGVVVDSHGAPVAGVLVRFLDDDAAHDRYDDASCMTASDGAFECDSLGGGTYAVAVFGNATMARRSRSRAPLLRRSSWPMATHA